MKSKTFKVSIVGTPDIAIDFSKFDGLPKNSDNFYKLDSDIEFIVVDLRQCHGNTCKGDKSGWLCDRANKWSIHID